MIQKTLISIIVIFLLCFLHIKFLNYNSELNNKVENFEDLSIIKHYDYTNYNSFEETIFEESLKKEFNMEESRIVCNVLPILSKEDCMSMPQQSNQINLFPVHLLELDTNIILGVFNNGYIYKKNNLSDKYWSGPIKNSLPNNNIPLRMITTDYDGKILGVGYNNKLYRKIKTSKNFDIESEWELIPFSDDIIYVLYDTKLNDKDYKKNESKIKDDILIGVNKIGLLTKIKYEELGTKPFTPIANDDFKVLKIYFEKNGYMMAIGTDFNLYRKNGKQWENSKFNVFNKNESKLLDVIYDTDAKMYGLVFMDKLNTVELMKQKMVHYLSQFIPLEFLSKNDNKVSKMNFNERNRTKTGVNNLVYKLVDNYGYKTIQEVKSRLEINDIGKLRDMCKNRGYLTSQKYNNFKILNKIEGQNKKIDEMKTIISEMFKQDIDRNKIQESILFL